MSLPLFLLLFVCLSVCLSLYYFNLRLSHKRPPAGVPEAVPEVSSRLLGAGEEASLSLLRHLHSSCPLDSLPRFWKESLTLPTGSASRRWDVGARLAQQCPSWSQALEAPPRLCARSPSAGGRTDLVWERGKAACEPVLLVTSLSEQARKQRRTRGGARRADPEGGHRVEEAAQGPVRVLRAAQKG